MHGRCAIHDLAIGPDGHCVLCRRAPAAPRGSGARWVAAAVGVLLMCLAGAIVWKGMRGVARALAAQEADHAAAAPTNPVRLYSTSWCPYCAKARAWLNGQHVDYVELDIESNAWARSEYRRVNPRGSIPALDAYGEVVIGFDPQGYTAALQRGAARQPR